MELSDSRPRERGGNLGDLRKAFLLQSHKIIKTQRTANIKVKPGQSVYFVANAFHIVETKGGKTGENASVPTLAPSQTGKAAEQSHFEAASLKTSPLEEGVHRPTAT